MHSGARMFYNTQDMLWRRKLEEQADLQQAIELQGRRLMGLQLLDVKKQQHHRALSTGAPAPIPSPTHSPSFFNQPLILPSGRSSPEVPEGIYLFIYLLNSCSNWKLEIGNDFCTPLLQITALAQQLPFL